ncbi:DUF2935 domain-containing protein [Irregularibacter muris]|uniref:DUF2935 domain-containing protein n=1 Tax=Irregularibacter muris TaxID=1796619 RepID=A0AAE3L1Z5_9FIRM|nr:DUF2935 domain-containing protein [Irregularibacter muris]MCR1897734.1 DUF2935 domain-containing protein [Irregularibacter muris]
MQYYSIPFYYYQVLYELRFWVSLSREHPLFLQKMARCHNIIIKKDIKTSLHQHFTAFKNLYKELNSLLSPRENYSIPPIHQDAYFYQLTLLLKEVSQADVRFIHTLQELESLTGSDSSWIVLINHIALEQRQLLQICSKHSIQLKSMGY